MSIVDWLITTIPLLGVIWLAFYCKRYVRGIADFLAAGRVAGRYVICVGDMQAALSVITLVALCEQEYLCGLAIGFWSKVSIPISIFMSLTGYVLYRYRQTRALSLGQFLETRYNRPLRIIASSIRTVAEMMTNAIGPAVAARFFLYFLGIPAYVNWFGFSVPTYALTVFLLLILALTLVWPGGRISLLVTDALQGLMSYPIFVIFSCFVLSEISWSADVVPVMMDRIHGESFLNPWDIQNLREFNLFALLVTMFGNVLNRGAWIGNDTSASGRTPHEQKMAGVLGAWRTGFSMLMMTLLALFIITVMHAAKFKNEARDIRAKIISRVISETVPDPAVRDAINTKLAALPPAGHTIGADQPYSKKSNPDTEFLGAVHSELQSVAEKRIAEKQLNPAGLEAAGIRGAENGVFQQTRTLYYQMMAPSLLKSKLPAGVAGLFLLMMLMLLLSTDDSRIFNASATLVQDVVMPFRKRPFELKEHLAWLRGMSAAVCGFFFFASIFFAQLDYINMFVSIMCSLWLGAAGPIMLGGLYTRWGNTTGAFAALFFGSGTAVTGLVCQRNWAETIYPYLETTGYLQYVGLVFDKVTLWCSPIVVWEMSAHKFPVNSFEIYFLAATLGIGGYVAGSLLTYRKPYNLDKLLHRGEYAEAAVVPEPAWTWRNVYSKLIGITSEYTRGDKIIAWSVFVYAIIYQFLIAFVGVLVWNLISPWPAHWWSYYFYFTIVVVGLVVGAVSTVWFMWGGTLDLFRLFRDLAARKEDPSDDGWVEKEKE